MALPEEDSTAVVGDEAVALGGVAELAGNQGGGELEEEAPSRAARRFWRKRGVPPTLFQSKSVSVAGETGARSLFDGAARQKQHIRPDLLKQVFACPSNTTTWEAVVSAGEKVWKAVASPHALRGMIGVSSFRRRSP